MIRGSVLLAACVGLWSCSSDPTADEAGKPYKIVSLPSVVFIKQDSAQLIAFQLVDQLDGQIPETWTIAANSANFTVALDSSFRPVYNSDGSLSLPEKQTEVRATLTGAALGISSLTVSAGGKSLTIPVNVIPGTLYATFTPANPAPGDTVTMTVPAQTLLSQASAVTFPGNVNPVIVDRAADSTSLRFISAPTTDTTAVVTLVHYTTTDPQFGTLPAVTLSTQTKVTGTQSAAWNGQLPATLSPLVGGVLTVTLNAPFAFKCNVACTTPASVQSAFTFPTQTAPIIASVSADSTIVDVNVGPNVASPLLVTRVMFKGAPQFEYTVASPDSVYSAVISNFPATLSVTNPQIGQPIVLTAGAGFSFSATALPTWPNGGPAVVMSRTATTLTVQPWPGSTGSPSVTGVISATAPAFQLTLPAVLPTALTMQATAAAIPPIAGTGAFGTAPAILLGNAGVFDSASFGCVGCGVNGFDAQIYTITVPAGSRTFTLTYSNNSDLGLYFQSTAGGGPVVTTGCDAHGNGATAQPETCTATFPAGTYFLNVENFAPAYPDPDPIWIAIHVQ